MPVTLKTCPNFRSLSGYKKTNGTLTNGAVYRSDSLAKINADDIKTLCDNNIRCIIDLRYTNETAENPNPLDNNPLFSYYNVSLTDGLHSGNPDALLDKSMWDFYIGLAEEANTEIARVFKIMAANAKTGIVFHCTAGKDRTGIIAALLLLCCGVTLEDVTDDYTRTYALLLSFLDEHKANLRARGVVFKDYVFLSEPDYIERFINHIEQKYTGAGEYLLNAGVSPGELNIIKTLL